MAALEGYITKDGDLFYFDTETYQEGLAPLTIEYQDGDIVKWTWEDKRMFGTLRSVGYETGLFVLEKVRVAS